MPSRIHLSAILLIAAVVWAAVLSFAGVQLSATWFRPFSTVLTVLLLVFVAFDLWAWRFRFLQGWFVPRPDVRGTWQVVLQSDWKAPATGQTIGPIAAFLVVRQTFSIISMRMLTAESSSELVGAAIAKANDGTFKPRTRATRSRNSRRQRPCVRQMPSRPWCLCPSSNVPTAARPDSPPRQAAPPRSGLGSVRALKAWVRSSRHR